MTSPDNPQTPNDKANQELRKQIRKTVRWGDYQNADESWGNGIANMDELMSLIESDRQTQRAELFDEFEKRAIGEIESEDGDAYGTAEARNDFRRQQRTVLNSMKEERNG